jgi:clorobiocin biosynthesis protein CloN5
VRQEEISAKILSFVRSEFLAGDPQSELTEDSPLLEWGVLNSLNTALLLTYIREEYGAFVPPARINARDMKNVRVITAMVAELVSSPQA